MSSELTTSPPNLVLTTRGDMPTEQELIGTFSLFLQESFWKGYGKDYLNKKSLYIW